MTPHRRIKNMDDDFLKQVWEALSNYDPKEWYDENTPMDDWAQMIYSEMTVRGFKTD